MNNENYINTLSDIENNQLPLGTENDPLSVFPGNGGGTGDISVRIVEEMPLLKPAQVPEAIEIAPANHTSSSDIDVGADADILIGDRGTGEFDALTNQQSTADAPVNLLGWSFNVVPEALDFGDSIEMELVVENIGDGDAGTFDVAFYMSADDRFDSEDYYFGNLTVDGLAGNGKTELLAISFVLPAATDPYWDTVGDVVTIGMVVDIANAIAETDEYDNVRVLSEVDAETVAIAPVDPDPEPDPEPAVVNLSGLSFDVVPDSLRTGDRFDAELQVQNTGNSEVGEFPISLYISADEIITTADLLLDDLIVSSLAGNSSSDTLTVSLILPDASDPFWTDDTDNFFIGAIADPANIIPETDETDNANLGEAIDYEGIQITQRSEPEDPTDPTEDDNVNLSGIYLNVVPEPLEFGDGFELEFVAGNTEAGEAENVPVTFYLSTDEIIDASDYNFGSYTIDRLAGNSNTDFLTTNVTLPGSEDPFWNGEGYYYVLMGVDVDNRISETNEGDNSNTGELIDWDGVEITDPNKIDLSAVAFNVVQEPLSPGDSFGVEYQIQNTENLDAGEFLVNIYLSADGTIDSEDLLLGSETIGGLAGNSQTDLLTGSYSLPAADHAIWNDGDIKTIGIVVDAANGVSESNEDNNANLSEYVDSDSVQITLPIEEAPVEPVEPPTRYNFPRENQPAIGIIDTGFAADNPDLDYSRLVLGRDRIDNDNDPLLTGSGDEHGTHVLGIIGATQDNAIGIDGLNDDAPIWLARAIDSGEWAASLTEFVDYVRSSGQPNAIANISFDLTQVNRNGSVTTRYELTPEERQALGYARQHGVLIVVAAGNDGGVMSVLGQASQEFDNIITVGAADGSNRAVYSSYGNGLNILAGGGTTENPVLSLVGDGVGTMAGTSVAAAQVTGAASLVWAANPDLNYRQVIEAITASATDLQASGWDAQTGAGLLNVDEAVETAENMRGTTYNPQAFFVPTTWGGEGEVTPGERAVQSVNINPSWRTIYSGWLNSSNPEDKFNFYLSRTTPLQLALKFPGSINLKGPGVNVSQRAWGSNDIFYNAGYLQRGNYTLTVGLGSRSRVEPYELILNFIPGSEGRETANRVTLPRPIVDDNGTWQEADYLGYLDNDSETVRDSIGGGDENDYYWFRLSNDSDFELSLTNLRSDADVRLLDSSRRTIGSSRNNGSASEYIDGSLSSGKYYVRVYNYESSTDYKLRLEANTSDPDGERSKATYVGRLNGGEAYYSDSIGYNGDRYDYYRFYISNSSDFELSLTGMRDDANVRLLNSSGSYITSSTRNGSSSEYISRSLSAGTYYVGIYPDGSYDRTSYTLNMSATDNSIRINGYTVEGDFFPVFDDNRSHLGNPTSNANYRSGNQYQSFQKGMIARSQYGTLPVYGDIYQEYNSLGGVSSWLGVPRVGQLQQGHGFVKQDFQNGYVIWNGVNSVAYQVGNGTPQYTSPDSTPSGVRDINNNDGYFTGRHEYSGSVNSSDRYDYYRFTVEELWDFNQHYLRFAVRDNNGNDISQNQADIKLLDQNWHNLGLSESWRPGVGPAGAALDGGTYYVAVEKKGSGTTNYDLVMHLDSARQDRSSARHLGNFSGRHEFYDFVGIGDDYDYYRLDVDEPSFLRFSLRDGQGDVDLLDSDGTLLTSGNSNDDGHHALDDGSYFLRVKPVGDINSNYKLTLQMAEDFGNFTGRKEYKNRYLGFSYPEDFYRFSLDRPGDLHLALRDLSADVNMQLYRDNGGGIFNATAISSPGYSDQRGREDEYKLYEDLSAGDYMLEVKLASGELWANYDLIVNADRVGNSADQAANLGDLSGKREVQTDFVGTTKADPVDFYKFTTDGGRERLMYLALRDLQEDANVYLLDGDEKEIASSTLGGTQHELLSYELERNSTYYVKVKPANNSANTNYQLVLNLQEAIAPIYSGGGDGVLLNEYYQALYGHKNAASSRQFDVHNAIDSNVLYGRGYSKDVFALAGGEVTYVKNDGLELNGVAELYNNQIYNKGYHPSTNELVTASNYNNMVKIWNEELQREFTYLHFETVLVNEGDPVEKGDRIGIEGNTGYSTNDHTHVEVDDRKGVGGNLEDPQVTLANIANIDNGNNGGSDNGNNGGSDPSEVTLEPPQTDGGDPVFPSDIRNSAIQGLGSGDLVVTEEAQYIRGSEGNGWLEKYQYDGNPWWLSYQDGQDTAYWVHGDNLREYQEQDGPEGVLGFPLTNEKSITASDGTSIIEQEFSGFGGKARIYNHPSLGSVATWGSIGSKYLEEGGPNSWLGVPTEAEWTVRDTIWAEFENGRIANNKITGETEAIGKWDRPSWIAQTYHEQYESLKNQEYDKPFHRLRLVVDGESPTTWEMTAQEMLEEYKDLVILAAQYYGVDGRAIAGAIRWEYELNEPSRERDKYAYGWVVGRETGSFWPFNGTGWGKMHHTTARKILAEEGKTVNEKQLAAMLALAPTAIDLIAKEMRRAAKAYYNEGFEIYDDPGVITTLYRIGEDQKDENGEKISYQKRAENRKNKKQEPEIESGTVDVVDFPVGEIVPDEIKINLPITDPFTGRNLLGLGLPISAYIDLPEFRESIFVENMGSWVHNQAQNGNLDDYKTFET